LYPQLVSCPLHPTEQGSPYNTLTMSIKSSFKTSETCHNNHKSTARLRRLPASLEESSFAATASISRLSTAMDYSSTKSSSSSKADLQTRNMHQIPRQVENAIISELAKFASTSRPRSPKSAIILNDKSNKKTRCTIPLVTRFLSLALLTTIATTISLFFHQDILHETKSQIDNGSNGELGISHLPNLRFVQNKAELQLATAVKYRHKNHESYFQLPKQITLQSKSSDVIITNQGAHFQLDFTDPNNQKHRENANASHGNHGNNLKWSWPIIHIVSTRFMQGQGSLLHLARSRLKLFQAICLPSIRYQSVLSSLRVDDDNIDDDGGWDEEENVLLRVYNSTKWGKDVARLTKWYQHQKEQNRRHRRKNRFTQYTNLEIDPLFLWVIKVDPNLDKQILDELISILDPVRQYALVVGSLNNFGIGVHPGGWRDGQAGRDILEAFHEGRVYFPRKDHEAELYHYQSALDVVGRAHVARSDRVVLETRLDADDAIHLDYFATLYDMALKLLIDPSISGYSANSPNGRYIKGGNNSQEKPNDKKASNLNVHPNPNETARWLYWCPQRHIQWNPSTDFFDPNHDPGLLTILESPNVCVTPGLSLGFAMGTEEEQVPRYEHTKIYWEITVNHRKKKKMQDNVEPSIQYASNDNRTDKHNCGLYPSSKCVIPVKDPKIAAFRSRAMTSAGMHNIEANGIPTSLSGIPDRFQKFSTKLWKSMDVSFGIDPREAKVAADFMMGNYVNTVRDNLKGQCTHGHSCKESSLEKLLRTIDLVEEGVGGIEI